MLWAQARNNTFDDSEFVFDPKFLDTIATWIDANEMIFNRILDEANVRQLLADFYLARISQRAHSSPNGDRLEAGLIERSLR